MAKRKPKKKQSSGGDVEVRLDEKSKKKLLIIIGLFAVLMGVFIVLELMQ